MSFYENIKYLVYHLNMCIDFKIIKEQNYLEQQLIYEMIFTFRINCLNFIKIESKEMVEKLITFASEHNNNFEKELDNYYVEKAKKINIDQNKFKDIVDFQLHWISKLLSLKSKNFKKNLININNIFKKHQIHVDNLYMNNKFINVFKSWDKSNSLFMSLWNEKINKFGSLLNLVSKYDNKKLTSSMNKVLLNMTVSSIYDNWIAINLKMIMSLHIIDNMIVNSELLNKFNENLKKEVIKFIDDQQNSIKLDELYRIFNNATAKLQKNNPTNNLNSILSDNDHKALIDALSSMRLKLLKNMNLPFAIHEVLNKYTSYSDYTFENFVSLFVAKIIDLNYMSHDLIFNFIDIFTTYSAPKETTNNMNIKSIQKYREKFLNICNKYYPHINSDIFQLIEKFDFIILFYRDFGLSGNNTESKNGMIREVFHSLYISKYLNDFLMNFKSLYILVNLPSFYDFYHFLKNDSFLNDLKELHENFKG